MEWKMCVGLKYFDGELHAMWMTLCVDASGRVCPGNVSGWVKVDSKETDI